MPTCACVRYDALGCALEREEVVAFWTGTVAEPDLCDPCTCHCHDDLDPEEAEDLDRLASARGGPR